jgi:hypothetical protein
VVGQTAAAAVCVPVQALVCRGGGGGSGGGGSGGGCVQTCADAVQTLECGGEYVVGQTAGRRSSAAAAAAAAAARARCRQVRVPAPTNGPAQGRSLRLSSVSITRSPTTSASNNPHPKIPAGRDT